MSQLQLSGKLIKDIRDVISGHDAAASDPGVASQYLSAVIGFLLGQEDMPDQKKDEILEELMAFASHVAADVQRQNSGQTQQAQQQASGVWKPGMS